MPKSPATYAFRILTDDEATEVHESIAAESWENALMDGKMLRMDRRPRFTQAMRHRIREADMAVRSLSRDGAVYLWLEGPEPS